MRKILFIGFMIILATVSLSCASTDKSRNILFEDDFESYELGSVPDGVWKKSGQGSVNIDASKKMSGTQSARFISGETYKNHAFLKLDKIFPVKKNRYYASMYMYVDEASPDGVHWTMLQSSGEVKGENYRSEIRYGGQKKKRLMANYETMGVASDCWQHSSVKIPEQEWFKVQWFFDGQTDSMKFWLNDELLEEISLTKQGQGCLAHDTNDQWRFPVFENLFIGWVDYQSGGGSRILWIDDVRIWQE